MKRLFGKLPAATVAILVPASFAMAPYVDAAAARGGGGGGGGGARAGGGGGGGGGAQAHGGGGQAEAQATTAGPTRANNVRSTSVK